MKSTNWFLLLVFIAVLGCGNKFSGTDNSDGNMQDLNIRRLFKSESYKTSKREVVVEYEPSSNKRNSIIYSEKLDNGLYIEISGSKQGSFFKSIYKSDSPIEESYDYNNYGKLISKYYSYVGYLYKDSLGNEVRPGFRIQVGKSYEYENGTLVKETDSEEGYTIKIEEVIEILKSKGIDFNKQAFIIERATGTFFGQLLENKGFKDVGKIKLWSIYLWSNGIRYYYLIDGNTGEIIHTGLLILRDS